MKFKINTHSGQIAIIPTIGIVTRCYDYRFRIAFIWLNIQASIGFFKEAE